MIRVLPHLAVLFFFVLILPAASAQEAAPPGEPAAAAAQAANSQDGPSEPGRVPAELEQRYEQMKTELAKDLPKRDIKVAQAPAVKEQLFRADVKLFENKFGAYLTLRPPGIDIEDPGSIQAHASRFRALYVSNIPFPEKLRGLRRVGDRFLHEPPSRQPRGGRGGFGSPRSGNTEMPAHFAELAELCPAQLRPDKQAIEFLTSADCARDVMHYGRTAAQDPQRGSAVVDLVYAVFAPSAEAAEARAKAVVGLYDGGFSRPMQEYLLATGENAIAEARGQYAELAQLPAAIEAERKKAAQPTEISDDILTQLKAQKVLVAVELAGLNARVKACDAMLKDVGTLPPSTLSSVNDMKVKAEVERVGIKEKLDQINKFIAEGDARKVANSKWQHLMETQGRTQSRIRSNELLATRCADAFQLCAPFEVVDNQITVAPVEWTE